MINKCYNDNDSNNNDYNNSNETIVNSILFYRIKVLLIYINR